MCDYRQSPEAHDETADLDQTIAEYYDSLTDEEVKENALWGEFALRQLQ